MCGSHCASARDEALLQAAGWCTSVYLEALGMTCQPLKDRGAGIGGVSRGHILHHKPSSDSIPKSGYKEAIEPSVCKPRFQVSITQ